ncbi:MAG: hypothetical protein AXA67_00780 [Methylothermaceae bacteria B42]|nr:MAG: hypothetical protein AXA67_00780 [Methylothermaceae bacteria B42]HHJ39687.1 YcgL domain-containing protein [Methylothermaceae bacterium]
MKCYVYRSRKQDEMYLFLKNKDDFSAVPPELMPHFVNPVFVFELELTPQRKLARADVTTVMQSLEDQGFYLQVPPPKTALG